MLASQCWIDPLTRLPPPSAPSATASARIELLRLFLVAQVVLGHLTMLAFPDFGELQLSRTANLVVAGWRLFTRFGQEAAVVFVCLSGYFLVPRLLAAALRDPAAPALGEFLRGRLRRIYPTLIAAVALTYVCDRVGIDLLGEEELYRSVMSYDAVAALNWPAAIGNLLSLQPTFAGAFGSNGPLWTLGYIVQFYVAGAVLAGCGRINRYFGLAALCGVLGLAAVYRLDWAILFVFWLGCSVTRWLAPQGPAVGAAALAAGLGLFVLANVLPRHIDFAMAGLAGMLLVVACNARLLPGRFARLPDFLRPAAAASYQFYALHMPLALLAFASIHRYIDPTGLAFRAVWPVLACLPGLAAALLANKLLHPAKRSE